MIGPPRGLAPAVARGLRRQGRSALQAIPADAIDDERIAWLLDEAGRPGLIVVVDTPPYATSHALLAHTHADVVLVAEQRAPMVGAPPRSFAPWPVGRGLKVVGLGRAGRRWFRLGARRAETLSSERAAALVLRQCPLPAAVRG